MTGTKAFCCLKTFGRKDWAVSRVFSGVSGALQGRVRKRFLS